MVGGSVLLGCVAPTKECAEGSRSYGQSSGDLALYGRAAKQIRGTPGVGSGPGMLSRRIPAVVCTRHGTEYTARGVVIFRLYIRIGGRK